MAPRLRTRDVVPLVVVKLIALAVIYALFFSPAHRAPIDAKAHLLGPPSTSHR